MPRTQSQQESFPQEKARHARKRSDGPPHLAIRSSRIDTEGCYTTRPIRQGEFVIEYTGPRLTIKEADALYEHASRTYLFGLADGKHVIDGEGVGAFINHSCDPNCEVDEVNGRILITAIRDIPPEEEITYDYNLYDGNPTDPSLCSCGAKNCRGSMYSMEELARRAKARARRKSGSKTANRKKKKSPM
jgi:SET domain-containing protein